MKERYPFMVSTILMVLLLACRTAVENSDL